MRKISLVTMMILAIVLVRLYNTTHPLPQLHPWNINSKLSKRQSLHHLNTTFVHDNSV
jgi:hypothetical protein